MEVSGRHATPEMVHAIMSNTTSRILNGITAFTSVMNSATSFYNTTVRAATWPEQGGSGGEEGRGRFHGLNSARPYISGVTKAPHSSHFKITLP